MEYKIGAQISRLISSFDEIKITIRVAGSVSAVGKTMRVHIILDRGLGLEVPIYWLKPELNCFKKKGNIKAIYVKPLYAV